MAFFLIPFIPHILGAIGAAFAAYGALKPPQCPEGYVWNKDSGKCVMGKSFQEAFAGTLPESKPATPSENPLGIPLWGWGAALATAGVAALAVAGRKK